MDLSAKLSEDLIFWKVQLRLMDWTIRLKVSSATKGQAGMSRKLSDYKDAEIIVATPESLPDSFLGNSDPEVTLVHELLHLQGEEMDDFIHLHEDGRWKNDHERFIELTAIALVNLRRMANVDRDGDDNR